MAGAAVAVALWAGGFLIVGYAIPSAMELSRTSINHGMASNIADEIIKEARVTSWTRLGTEGAGKPALLGSGYLPVTTGKIKPASVEKIRNVDMKVKTAVGEKGATGYGSRMIAVEVSWSNRPSGKVHTIVQSVILSPPAGALSPPSIPTLDAP